MVDQLDEEFVRVLESHRGVPAAKALIPIRDPTFGVLTCVQDEPFFVQMVEVLNTDPQQNQGVKNAPSAVVKHKLALAMKNFMSAEQRSPDARRAVVTASLSLFRHSCALRVPTKLAGAAAHTVLRALAAVTTTSAAGAGGAAGAGSNSRKQNQQRQQKVPVVAAAAGTSRENLVLGSEGFPESQVAAFLLDATRAEPPPLPTPPIAVPADVAVKIIAAFGVGKGSKDALEWGSPSVSDCLRGSVRRVANRLQREGKWDLMVELVEHMETAKGIEECEGVLGLQLGELIASAMLKEEWDSARRLVSSAAAGPPRQTLARALIPAATDAGAFEVAVQLIEDNRLVSEFPDYQALLDKVWVQNKKRSLSRVVVKPGWKMAQQLLDRKSRHKRELAIWLVEHMLEQRNLPAAAALMDHFHLHRDMPPLDPALVEASAREIAAAHLQLPIDSSRVVVVDGSKTLQYAQRALLDPPAVGGRGAYPGVRCVGLDVENCPATNRAVLFQVATSTGVFLFDLVALFSRRANLDVFPRFDATMEALLSNPRIVKLGFSFKQDAAALRKACPEVRGFRQIEPLLEVGVLSSAVLGRETPSLTKTCREWLGKPLDKTECASKWANRPLTVDQVKYAALDAHCLVGIFEEILIDRAMRRETRAAAAAAADGRGERQEEEEEDDDETDPHEWWSKFLSQKEDRRNSSRSRR
ncbi:unnamed protein product [Pylaiella littoralis]